MITSLQRVSAEAVEIEAAAACDEDLLSGAPVVVEPLQIITPLTVLVYLIKDPQLANGELMP